MRTPGQDIALAWQTQSRTGAGRDFLVLFENALAGTGSHLYALCVIFFLFKDLQGF